MSEALYERYKDALRRGHVAAMRGRHAEALEAYSEAARIAPDRTLPLTGIAGVLLKLGKRTEALSTFDAALDRAPGDEMALRGRADLLVATGDRIAAAETLDRLAIVLDTAGRLPDAADAARRALELAESRSRRATVRTLITRLRESSPDPEAIEALTRASAVLERGMAGGRTEVAGAPTTVAAASTEGDGDADGRRPDPPAATPEPEPPPPAAPPFDPIQAIGAVEEAALGDDPGRTRTLALTAADGHRAAGHASTAIDACYMALAGSPADPGLHLTLAELYLDQGWRVLAADKLHLLHRLATLEEDHETIERIRVLAGGRLPDEPGLAALAAAPGA